MRLGFRFVYVHDVYRFVSCQYTARRSIVVEEGSYFSNLDSVLLPLDQVVVA